MMTRQYTMRVSFPGPVCVSGETHYAGPRAGGPVLFRRCAVVPPVRLRLPSVTPAHLRLPLHLPKQPHPHVTQPHAPLVTMFLHRDTFVRAQPVSAANFPLKSRPPDLH